MKNSFLKIFFALSFFLVVFVLPSNANATTAVGPLSPTTGGWLGGGSAWVGYATNIYASDGVSASTTISNNGTGSKYLTSGGYGFSIPADATIDGIVVQVQGYDPGNNGGEHYEVQMKKKVAAFYAKNAKNSGYLTGSNSYYTFGSSSDLWGNTWTPADVNDPGFGVAIKAYGYTGDVVNVDYVTVTVYYTALSPSPIPIPFPIPTVTISASPTTVNSGSSSTISWTPANAASCVASDDWSGSKDATDGTYTESTGALTSSKTYTISCSGPGGTSSPASVTVNVNASCSSSDLSGYAWSSNVGWISFNSVNSGAGGGPYKVSVDGSGNLTGYAWSSNVGWIKFGGLSGFPSGAGTSSQNAQIIGGQLRGWVKVLSADGNGWDGWISLTGTNYGVTKSGADLSGYAWGSDVVGWISFKDDVNNYYGVTVGCANVPIVTISANPTSGVKDIVNPTLTWSATNNPTSCTSTGDWKSTPATATSSNQTQSQGILTSAKTYTYTLTCSNANGSGSPASATVVVAEPVPNLDFSATNTNNGNTNTVIGSSAGESMTVEKNSPVTLNWTIANLTSCSAIGSDWNQSSKNTIASNTNGNGTVTLNTIGNHDFEISCYTLDFPSENVVSSIMVNVTDTGGVCPTSGVGSHLLACVSGIKGPVISSPSKWSWTCGGISCSESKSPIFIES
jgi:hypothetical protein